MTSGKGLISRPNNQDLLQEVWLAVNAECAKAIEGGDTQDEAPQQLRRCHVCEREDKGLLRCAGCKKRGHAECIGKAAGKQVGCCFPLQPSSDLRGRLA